MAPTTCATITEGITPGQFLFGDGNSTAMFLHDVRTNLTCPIEGFHEVIYFAEGLVFKGKPTVCGGLSTNQCFNYDPSRAANSHWMLIPGIFTTDSERPLMRMVSFGADKVALMGGTINGTNAVISFNSNGSYTTEAPLPEPLAAMCALNANERLIFVAGGLSSDTARSQAYLYDTTNGNIVNLANMTEVRGGIRCQSRLKTDGSGGQEIVVVGGQGSNGYLSTTEIYDIASNEWRSGPSLPFPVAVYICWPPGIRERPLLYLLGASMPSMVKLKPSAPFGNWAPLAMRGRVTDLTPVGVGRVAMSTPG